MQDKLGKIGKLLKQQWILIWMVISLVGLFALIAYASYEENNNKIKRVVAPAADIGRLFTSNYLTVSGGVKSVYYQENDSSPFTFPVEVRSFNPSDPNTKYQGTISYSLTASLAHMSGESYSADELDGTNMWNTKNMSITISKGTDKITLSGGTITESLGTGTKYELTNEHDKDTWTVSFNNIPLNSDYGVTIIAFPTNQDLEKISQTLCVSSVPVIYTEGWNCEIVDDTNRDISNYDAFNYTITGTGKKTLKFSYDSSVFEINPSFYSFVSEASVGVYSGSTATGRDGWKTLTILADPDITLVNRYDFQVYKVNSLSPESFDELKQYIEFEQLSTN